MFDPEAMPTICWLSNCKLDQGLKRLARQFDPDSMFTQFLPRRFSAGHFILDPNGFYTRIATSTNEVNGRQREAAS